MLQSIIAKGSSSAKAALAGEQILVRQNLHFYFLHQKFQSGERLVGGGGWLEDGEEIG